MTGDLWQLLYRLLLKTTGYWSMKLNLLNLHIAISELVKQTLEKKKLLLISMN